MMSIGLAMGDGEGLPGEAGAPLVRSITAMAGRVLRELVVRSPTAGALFEDDLHEVRTRSGIALRSSIALLRWQRRAPSVAAERLHRDGCRRA
jgi:hypothetical protein